MRMRFLRSGWGPGFLIPSRLFVDVDTAGTPCPVVNLWIVQDVSGSIEKWGLVEKHFILDHKFLCICHMFHESCTEKLAPLI